MKKILTIALIAALFVTSAFAVSFTGSAALELGYDLDSKDYGFVNNYGPKLVFGFELGSGEGGSAGEKDLRAEIAGTFTVAFKENDSDSAYTSTASVFPVATITTLKISKANILYKDILTVGILSAGSSADYAKSYKTDDDGNTLSDQVKALSGSLVKDLVGEDYYKAMEKLGFDPTIYGFTADAFDVKTGFGFNGNAGDDSWHAVLAHAALTDKAFVENLKVSAGGAAGFFGLNYGLEDKVQTVTDLQANAKVAYDNQDKLSASVAVDFGAVLADKDSHMAPTVGIKAGESSKIAFELAANAKYDFASLDLYYYSVDKFENNILDGKVAASYTFEEKYTVGGSFEINNVADDARNAGVDKTDVNGGKREYTLAADGEAIVDAFTFGATFSYGFEAQLMKIGATVKYTHEMFTANLGANFEKTIDVDKTSVFYVTAGISSDAVIDGATLALTYGKGSAGYLNLLKDQTKPQSLGKITASAKVFF